MMFIFGGNNSGGIAMTQALASSQLMRAKHDQLTLIELYNNIGGEQEAYLEDGRIRFRDRPKDYFNEIQELKQEIKELKSFLERENK